MASERADSPWPRCAPVDSRVPICPLRTVTPMTKAIQPRIAIVRWRALQTAARAAMPLMLSVEVMPRRYGCRRRPSIPRAGGTGVGIALPLAVGQHGQDAPVLFVVRRQVEFGEDVAD